MAVTQIDDRREREIIEEKLNREFSSYIKQLRIDIERIKKLSLADFLSNKMLIITAIRSGIPYSLFDLIQDYTPFSENDWANFLDISRKTLQRYKTLPEHNFISNHSEKIIEILEVTKVGLDVFDNMDKLRLWFNTPNYALGNLRPIELLKDSYGKELVIGELTRINHGILV